MSRIQAAIDQAQTRGGLESIALISSLGLPVASIGVDIEIGVMARTIFSVFDRAASEFEIGEAEHIHVDGTSRSFIVKPLRKVKGKLHSWFVAVAPTFGGEGAFKLDTSIKTTMLTPTGFASGTPVHLQIDETKALSAVTALWSTIPMIESFLKLGDVCGVYLDGETHRLMITPDCENWIISLFQKERRVGRIDVELDRAAIILLDIL